MPQDESRWRSEQDRGRSREERYRGGYGREKEDRSGREGWRREYGSGYGQGGSSRGGYAGWQGGRTGGGYGAESYRRDDAGGSYVDYEGSFGGYEREGRYGQEGYGGRYGREDDRGYGREGYSGRGGQGRGLWQRTSDEVSSWFGDAGAERRREQDYRGRGPKGYRRSDERIREDVSERLADAPDVDASEIEVSVRNGEVTLSGSVDSRQARRRAEDLAESVSGVSHVQNNLRVQQQGALRTSGYGAGAGSGLAGGSGTTIGTTGDTTTSGTKVSGTTAGATTTEVGDAPRVGGFGESIAYAAGPGSDAASSACGTSGTDASRRTS
jgi:osmotically-inducible protein OsmY